MHSTRDYAAGSGPSVARRKSRKRCRWWRHQKCAKRNRPRWLAAPLHLLYRIQREATTRMGEFSHPLLEMREVRKRAVILIAADKGLCGALNGNLFRVASRFDPAIDGLHHGRTQSSPIRRSNRASVGREIRYADTPRFSDSARSQPSPVISF